MSTKNAISNKTGSLELDSGASGDSFIQFDINTTGVFRIGVDDTDDSFRISQGSVLGTNDTFVMTDAGERTMPLQPAFCAYNSSTDSNVTGSGQFIQIYFDSEIFDQGGDYDDVTSTFTAPVSGRYYFILSVSLSGLEATQSNNNIRIQTSNRTYLAGAMNLGVLRDVSTNFIENQVCFADMDAADTAICKLFVNGGTQSVDFVGGASSTMQSFFAGYLVC